MNKIKNILFPTDFSENTENALTFALEIARTYNATLHIMHSIEEPYDFAPMIKDIRETLDQRVKLLFDRLKNSIKEDEKYSSLDIKTYMQTGRAQFTILEESRERDIDLVVMGTKGRTGLEKFFFGSSTAEVIQHSHVPVLAVPKEAEYDGFKQIVFTTDYQDGDIEALKYTTDFADLFGSKIKVFHSSLENGFRAEIMFRGLIEVAKESIPYQDIDFDHDITNSFFDAISNQMLNGNISLLVMNRYEESLSIFKKHQTKEMSYYTIVPLLILPIKEMIKKKEKQS